MTLQVYPQEYTGGSYQYPIYVTLTGSQKEWEQHPYPNVYIEGCRFVTSASQGWTTITYVGCPLPYALNAIAVIPTTTNDGDYWNLTGSTWTGSYQIYVKSSGGQIVWWECTRNCTGSESIYFSFYQTGSQSNTVYIDWKIQRSD